MGAPQVGPEYARLPKIVCRVRKKESMRGGAAAREAVERAISAEKASRASDAAFSCALLFSVVAFAATATRFLYFAMQQ